MKTYDYDGEKYANDVTLTKSGEDTSIESLKAEVSSIDSETVTSGSKSRIDEALENVNTLLDHRDDSNAISTLTGLWNTASDPLNYYAYAQNGYANTSSTALKQETSTLLDKTLYENDTNTAVSAASVKEAKNILTNAKVEVVTKEAFASTQAKYDEIGKLLTNITVGDKKDQYTKANVDAFKKAVATLKVDFNEATITNSELTEMNDSLEALVSDFTAKVNKADVVNTNTPNTNLNAKPTSSKTSSGVKTGDETSISLPLITSVVALMGAVAAKLLRKKIEE